MSDRLFNVREKAQTIEEVDKYNFEPIKGYPMLRWKGKRPFDSTFFFPAQLKETYGESSDFEGRDWINKIFWGDNLQVMSHLLKKFRGQVDLIYVDPPFDSKADYKKTISVRGKKAESDATSFEEKQYTDIWSNDEYLQFMYERLVLLRELLNEKGTIYLHCDYHKVHLLRCMLDEIFGPDNFVNEIVWQRTRAAHSDATGFGKVHDNILIYSKIRGIVTNEIYVEHDENYIERFNREIEGRKYMLVPLHAPSHSATASPAREFFGKIIAPPDGRCWPSQKYIDDLIAENKVELTSNGTPSKRNFLDENKGKPVSDWWDDIIPLNPVASERLDYPTQKPEQLLERVILASSNPGDLVFDCFMGSGTTQAVAMKLGRRFIGADINLGAIETTTKRLLKIQKELKAKTGEIDFKDGNETPLFTGFELYNVNNYDVFRNPVQAKDLLIDALEIMPLDKNSVYDGTKDDRMVKIMPVNRIATKHDLNELITGFNYKQFDERREKNPLSPVEHITLVCMGHDNDLAATLKEEMKKKGYNIDVEVFDILHERGQLQFKRDSEANIVKEGGKLIIKEFYPMNLLAKLSFEKQSVEDWRVLVDSIKIDWNYDSSNFTPTELDIPEKEMLVKGTYSIPEDAGTIRIKITDLLSESLELTIED